MWEKLAEQLNMVSGYNFHDYYMEGLEGTLSEGIISYGLSTASSPAVAFAMLSAYFAGKQESEMNDKMNAYYDQHDAYKTCLEASKIANEGKGASGNNGEDRYTNEHILYGSNDETVPEELRGMTYKEYMTDLLGGEDEFKAMADKNGNGMSSHQEWTNQCEVLNQEKDIQSSELNKLSTEMELAVQDSSQAQEMAANAVKKISDLLSAMSRAVGG